MIDFTALDPDTRCVALVGEFLRRWSKLEVALHEAIAKAMSLDETMRLVLCANISLRDKINLLRTLVNLSTVSTNEKSKFSKELNNLSNDSADRNMMAHDNFGPDETGLGVQFFQVKAKGAFSLPKVVWTIGDFQSAYARIDGFSEQIVLLSTAFTLAQFTLNNFQWGHKDAYAPIRRTMSSALHDFQFRHIPLVLVDDLANREKENQIPPQQQD